MLLEKKKSRESSESVSPGNLRSMYYIVSKCFGFSFNLTGIYMLVWTAR